MLNTSQLCPRQLHRNATPSLVLLDTLPSETSETEHCRLKVIGEDEWVLPLTALQGGCAQGPDWKGGKPINIVKTHNFDQNKDTY